MNNRLPLFILGFVLALVAFVGVFVLGRVASNVGTATVVVVIADRDIAPREVIDAGALALTRVPVTAAPPGFLSKLADVTGTTAQIRIIRGQALTANVITNSPDQITDPAPAYLPIPQGDVAFTLPTNEQQGVGGYIGAGDYIDIIATINTSVVSATNPKVVTATVFRHVHVIRVGPPLDAKKGGQQQGVSSSLTVVLGECDAKVLDWLIANASLRYLLESYKDYQPAATPAASTCPASGVVGPSQVDALFEFTKS
ncbi:MAG TPA: Flp pilus assembly protein CpaB [Candidatus Dormibacteraeota bacterium]